MLFHALVFFGQPVLQPGFLILRQKLRLFRRIIKIKEGGDTGDDGRNTRGEEYPFPTGITEETIQIEQHAAKRRADGIGKRAEDHEQADHAATIIAREPERHQEQDAGEETRLAEPEQEAQDVEHRGVLRIGKRDGDGAPGNQNAGEPFAGAETVEEKVARHLEEEIADEEQRSAKAVGIFAEAQRIDHLQLGIADILAVDIGDEIKKAKKRHQPPGDLRDKGFFGYHMLFPPFDCSSKCK
ncbi:hypothetical protein D3C72_1117010 [compost metagenome]